MPDHNKHARVDEGDEPILSSRIGPSDEASRAHPRPGSIDVFYVETEHAAAQEEQRRAYSAKGEEEAGPHTAKAAGLEHAKSVAVSASEHADALVAARSNSYRQAADELLPYVRRPADWKRLKYGRLSLLLLGDVGAISGAALLLGEEWPNAVAIGLSAGVSAVVLGSIGTEVKHLVTAGEREKDLDEVRGKYAQLFSGPSQATGIIKIVIGLCGSGIALIGGGVIALRTETQGALAGVAFGCLALGLGLASFYNSYETACEVGDLLDTEDAALRKARKDAKTAGEAQVIRDYETARSLATTARATNEALGEAAAAGIRRRLFSVLNNSPEVAGNGTGADQRPPTINGGSNGHGNAADIDPGQIEGRR